MVKKILILVFSVFVLIAVAPMVLSEAGINVTWRELLRVNHDIDHQVPHLAIKEGYTVEVYADDLSRPRFMYVTDENDVLVVTPGTDNITALVHNAKNPHKPKARKIVVQDLDRPSSIDYKDGWLYIGELAQVVRIRFDPKTLKTTGKLEQLVKLPDDDGHWTRTVRVGPDNKLYISVGSSCNVCLEKSPYRAAILQYDIASKATTIYATGLRNSVGLDWSPQDGELYATENGRDLLGDNFPPDELNKIKPNTFYGWPYYHGDNVADPKFKRAGLALTPPVHKFHPHNAPLGIAFLRHNPGLASKALVALHGSWNSSVKVGYKVVGLTQNKDGSFTEEDFITGFLQPKDNVLGRPVGINEAKDGSIYISDDFAGVVYRVFPNT